MARLRHYNVVRSVYYGELGNLWHLIDSQSSGMLYQIDVRYA